MSDPAAIAVETLRAELRQRRDGAMMPRLWHQMRDEWQRVQDRFAIAVTPSPARPDRHIACQVR